jgi:hypothetical protein
MRRLKKRANIFRARGFRGRPIASEAVVLSTAGAALLAARSTSASNLFSGSAAILRARSARCLSIPWFLSVSCVIGSARDPIGFTPRLRQLPSLPYNLYQLSESALGTLDHRNVALAEEVEHRPQLLSALGGRAAALLGADHLATCPLQGSFLDRKVLMGADKL